MTDIDILQKLASKKAKAEQIAEEVEKDFDLLDDVVKGFFSDKASVKFGCGKILMILSEKYPKKVYPKWDQIARNINSENNILKWNAIITLANLTVADKDKKFEKVVDKYFGLIKDPKMITAANVIGHSPIIAKAKPELTGKITNRLLEVEKGKWETSECRNIVLGKTITAFGEYFDQIQDKERVIKFVRKQLRNTRKSTAKKAEEFLKRFGE